MQHHFLEQFASTKFEHFWKILDSAIVHDLNKITQNNDHFDTRFYQELGELEKIQQMQWLLYVSCISYSKDGFQYVILTEL